MISLLTAVTLCFCLCGSVPGAGAAEDAPAADVQAASDALREGLAASADSIDLSGCRLPRGCLTDVFSGVLLDSPELFYVDSRLSYTYDRTGCVLDVFPVYTLSGGALADARQLWQRTVDDFCADLAAAAAACDGLALIGADGAAPEDFPAWGEADTVLFIHDRLAAAYEYDESGTRFDALSLFRDGCGVCQAYALAFLALARAAGLHAEVVVSAAMDHAWNRVCVDGAWYQVDVTRDDPITAQSAAQGAAQGAASCVRHERLFMSDGTAALLGYREYGTPPGHECVSGRFGAGGLAVCGTAFVRLGGGWYCEADGLLCRADTRDGSVGRPGDTDGDGELTLYDLLLLEHLLRADPDSPYPARLRILLTERAASPLAAGV